MRLIHRAVGVAAAVALAAAVAACSNTTSSGGGSASGQPQQGGTLTQAWVAATPNFIFPYAPATNTDGYNQNLTVPLWPPLAFDGEGGQSVVNPRESLYSALGYTNGNKTVT